MLLISLFAGLMFLARAVISFFICINVFGNTYPSFIDINLWDFITFLFNELLTSLLIGYTRQKDEKVNFDKMYGDYDFNKNYHKGLEINNEIKDEFQMLQEPLIDKEF